MNTKTIASWSTGEHETAGEPFARFRMALEWKLADLWVGAFWQQQRHAVTVHNADPEKRCCLYHETHRWICLLPCLPIHLSWLSRIEVL